MLGVNLKNDLLYDVFLVSLPKFGGVMSSPTTFGEYGMGLQAKLADCSGPHMSGAC